MELPPGTVDPIFLCELALELHMPISEMLHGRGTPMSANELTVVWPAFFASRARREELERKKREGR